MKGKSLLIIIFLAILLFAEACASSRGYKKKKPLKPGKPIPCPQKDC